MLTALLCGALSLAAMPAEAGPARAFAMTRGSGYATGNGELLVATLVLPAGTELTLVNLHIWGHSIYSDLWKTPTQRLFNSDVIPFGKSTIVRGVDTLPAGSYGFFCSNHTGMRGTLIVV